MKRLSTVLKRAGLHVESEYEKADAEFGITGTNVIEVYEVVDGEPDYSEPVLRLVKDRLVGGYALWCCWDRSSEVYISNAREMQEFLDSTDKWHQYKVVK